MSGKPTATEFTSELLVQYQTAALENASGLLLEAELLAGNQHYARAYFLSVVAIEEIGKAALAHFARGRNLKASNVQTKINRDFQDHSAKIRAAFMASMMREASKSSKKAMVDILHLIHDVRSGREPSLYVDIDQNYSVLTPYKMVRPSAARDCLRLGQVCWTETKEMLSNSSPNTFTAAQDKWYALGEKSNKVWSESDFGEYLMTLVEKDGFDQDTIPKAVTTYYEVYLTKGIKFVDD